MPTALAMTRRLGLPEPPPPHNAAAAARMRLPVSEASARATKPPSVIYPSLVPARLARGDQRLGGPHHAARGPSPPLSERAAPGATLAPQRDDAEDGALRVLDDRGPARRDVGRRRAHGRPQRHGPGGRSV